MASSGSSNDNGSDNDPPLIHQSLLNPSQANFPPNHEDPPPSNPEQASPQSNHEDPPPPNPEQANPLPNHGNGPPPNSPEANPPPDHEDPPSSNPEQANPPPNHEDPPPPNLEQANPPPNHEDSPPPNPEQANPPPNHGNGPPPNPLGDDPPPNHGDRPPCCPFTITVANFVTAMLQGNHNRNNYSSWREQILCLVDSQGLRPHLIDNPQQQNNAHAHDQAWNRTDRLLKGWILGSLSNELVKSVFHLPTTRAVWLELERKFLVPQGRPEPQPQPYAPNEREQVAHLEMYRAAMGGGDGNSIETLTRHRAYINARVGFTSETTLHVAVASGRSGQFVDDLVNLIVPGQVPVDINHLGLRDHLGLTPLHVAALTGNYEAARVLVRRLHDLLYESDPNGLFPVHLAAKSGHRGTLSFLIRSNVALDGRRNPLTGEAGLRLVNYMIDSDFLDLAFQLIERNDGLLARLRPDAATHINPALMTVAYRSKTFCVDRFNCWERFQYNNMTWLDMNAEERKDTESDLTNQVPKRGSILKKKLLHEQAIRLVRRICQHMQTLSHGDAAAIYTYAMTAASLFDVHEVIQAIVDYFPLAVHCKEDDNSNQTFLHVAVKYRSQNVFNLMYQTTNHKYHYINARDDSGNSILHMAALLAPARKLDIVPGPAFQMQSELQWFKVVEEMVSPDIRERPNHAGFKPSAVFRIQHEKLKIDGEKWMKDTASSCSIAAALIATVVFAAAITVPGGTKSDTGYPLLLGRRAAFTAFAVADVASLFTSITSLLMFLSIHTSSFKQKDFLTTLPRTLCIGIFFLILSIMLMMATFTSAVCVLFGNKKTWVVALAASAPALPVCSFLYLQMPVLYRAVSSTFGKGVFGKQSNVPFH